MKRADAGTRVLAIGVDAAESTFVEKLLADDELPALAALLARGRWCRLDSWNQIGSATVWPSFMTGMPPSVHGAYGEVLWEPDTMGVARFTPERLTPFWAGLPGRGVRVGVLDVPFAPLVGLEDGFEIADWGAHDVAEVRTRARPESVAHLLSTLPAHPFNPHIPDVRGPSDRRGAEAVAAACHRGVRQRGDLAARLLTELQPDLAIVVFPELHHAGHLLWHTVADDDPMFAGPEFRPLLRGPTVADLYRAVDAEIARLTSLVGPDCSVVIFAPHGMRPGWGTPTLVPALLKADRLALRPDWRSQSWRDRSVTLFAAAKRRVPDRARAIYRARSPRSLRLRLAHPTMLELHDWSRTRAFSLPTDHHGWVRVNLAGRERLGVVPGSEYAAFCEALEARLRGLTTQAGEPVVADVLRPARGLEEARRSPLPDLVVNWDAPAYVDPLDVDDGVPPAPATYRRRTGQHADSGFCIATGRAAEGLAGALPVEAMPGVLLGALGLED